MQRSFWRTRYSSRVCIVPWHYSSQPHTIILYIPSSATTHALTILVPIYEILGTILLVLFCSKRIQILGPGNWLSFLNIRCNHIKIWQRNIPTLSLGIWLQSSLPLILVPNSWPRPEGFCIEAFMWLSHYFLLCMSGLNLIEMGTCLVYWLVKRKGADNGEFAHGTKRKKLSFSLGQLSHYSW